MRVREQRPASSITKQQQWLRWFDKINTLRMPSNAKSVIAILKKLTVEHPAVIFFGQRFLFQQLVIRWPKKKKTIAAVRMLLMKLAKRVQVSVSKRPSLWWVYHTPGSQYTSNNKQKTLSHQRTRSNTSAKWTKCNFWDFLGPLANRPLCMS